MTLMLVFLGAGKKLQDSNFSGFKRTCRFIVYPGCIRYVVKTKQISGLHTICSKNKAKTVHVQVRLRLLNGKREALILNYNANTENIALRQRIYVMFC
jgi:hypothetical protein